jgi:peptide/nickel transport system substrate-binding protein
MTSTHNVPRGESTEVSRRHVLQLLGVGSAVGAAALAGCAPSKKANNAPGGNGGGGGGGDFHGAYPYTVPPKGHFNLGPGVTDGIALGIYLDLLYPSLGMYKWSDKTWLYLLGESHKVDAAAKTLTVKLKKGLTWSDGSPITSKDLVGTAELKWQGQDPSWKFLSDVKATDDQTVVYTMSHPTTVLERYILKTYPLPYSAYGPYMDKAAELRKSNAKLDSGPGQTAVTNFQKFRPKDPAVSGPFNWDASSITQQQLKLKKNDKGYKAGDIKFDTMTIYNGETPDVTPLVMSKDVDYATHGFPVASVQTFVKNGYEILKPPVYSGPAIIFNFDTHPEFLDVKVRQAIAMMIDYAANAQIALGESAKACKYMSGISDIFITDWVDNPGELHQYTKDLNKAADLLSQAGWKKQGDTWQTKDGKPAKYDIKYPTDYADWNPAASNAADQLSAQGIKLTKRGVVSTQLGPDFLAGKFDICIQGWGAAVPHPYFSYYQDFVALNPQPPTKGSMQFPVKQKLASGESVDLADLTQKSAEGLDPSKNKPVITQLAKAFNELLPIIPLWERYGNNPALEGTRAKGFPKADDPILKNSPYGDSFVIIGMYEGTLTPV